MLKSKKALTVIWCLAFAFSAFFTFYIPDNINRIVIIAMVFTCVGYLSQLLLWLRLLRTPQGAEGRFRNMPVAVASGGYLACVSAFGIICSAVQNSIPEKTTVIINTVVLIAAWIVIAALLGTKGYIQRVDSRQRNHHVEL